MLTYYMIRKVYTFTHHYTITFITGNESYSRLRRHRGFGLAPPAAA